ASLCSMERTEMGGEDSVKKPPTVEQLPPGPSTPSISQPKTTPGSDPGPSQDKAQLDTLLGILAASSSTLPPAAQQMIATIQESSVNSATKAKHKAVAEQARAQQALAKTQTQHTAYLQAWQQYITQLASLLEGQIQEQAAILEEFDQAELAWTQTEHAATQQLAKLTSDVRESESAEKEAEEADQVVDMAIEQEQKLKAASEESQHAAKRMLHALTDMRNTAAEQLQKVMHGPNDLPERVESSIEYDPTYVGILEKVMLTILSIPATIESYGKLRPVTLQKPSPLLSMCGALPECQVSGRGAEIFGQASESAMYKYQADSVGTVHFDTVTPQPSFFNSWVKPSTIAYMRVPSLPVAWQSTEDEAGVLEQAELLPSGVLAAPGAHLPIADLGMFQL
ncbi:unnamed protein product, partial [Symbiodinium necroappetens]